jgi:hypothetical protein
MAYETGTANNINDLLDKFRLFAIAQGWSVNRWATVGSGRELCIQKGSAFFNFRSVNNETTVINGSSGAGRYGLNMNGSDGYDGGSAWDRQPGYPLRTSSTGGDQGHVFTPTFFSAGPYPAYHFFAPDDKTLYGVLEVVTGTFLHWGLGSLDLFNGAAPGGGRFIYGTGGSYPSTATSGSVWLASTADNGSYALELVPGRFADYAATSGSACSGGHLRCAFGSFDNWAGSGKIPNNTNQFECWQGGGVHDRVLRDYSPSTLNGIGLLTPMTASVNRANEYLQPVGVFPGIRYMDMTNYLPGDEFTFGSDTWKVFPWFQKGGLSAQRGMAFLKVT